MSRKWIIITIISALIVIAGGISLTYIIKQGGSESTVPTITTSPTPHPGREPDLRMPAEDYATLVKVMDMTRKVTVYGFNTPAQENVYITYQQDTIMRIQVRISGVFIIYFLRSDGGILCVGNEKEIVAQIHPKIMAIIRQQRKETV